MTKAELRKIYLQKRLSLSDAEYTQGSLDICEKFFASMDLAKIKMLHLFLPLEKNKEPDTWLIINMIEKKFAHIRVSIPKVNTKANALENFFFESTDQLKRNAWGIPEPQYGEPTSADEMDMVLVPMLACDKHGHRVGYGKGFYDKFLSTCRPDCIRVGLSFFDPIEKIDDITPLDISLHYGVTPMKVHHF